MELDAGVARGAHHDLLEHPEVPDDVGLHPEVDYRIVHELARAVERDAAAPVHLVELRAERLHLRAGPHEVRRVGPSSRRVRRRMLQQQQRVRDLIAGALPGELVHPLVRARVRNDPGPEEPSLARHSSR